jgi:hypothetical protein
MHKTKKSFFIIFPIFMGFILVFLFGTNLPLFDDWWNVLLISLDACRADYLNCCGYHRKTSPFNDQLLKKGKYQVGIYIEKENLKALQFFDKYVYIK